MQNIGEKLEDARKRQGISIREAAEATKIRADFLIDFENNRFDQDLPDIYKRGFLKIYGKFLKLDVDKLGIDFNAQQLGHAAHARRERENLGRVEVPSYQTHHISPEQAEEAHAAEETDKSIYWKIGIVVALIFVFFGLIALFISILSGGDSTPSTSREANTSVASERTNVSQPDSGEAVSGPTSITLVATGDCTVMVRDAENTSSIIYRGSLSTGERVPLEIPGRVEIVSTEVQNIQVEHKGEVRRSRTGSGLGKFFIE